MTRMLAILALAALAVGCGTSPRAVERKGRIISLTDSILTTGGTDTVRFGRLGSGEIAVLRLWLANDASRPVAVASYRRSCGCTTLEFARRTGLAAQGAGHHAGGRAAAPAAVRGSGHKINPCLFGNNLYLCFVQWNKHLKRIQL